MADRHYLAFDLGAESARAVVGKLRDGQLTLQEKHRFANPTGRLNGHLVWNVLSQWEELKIGLKKAAIDQHAEERTAICIDGIGVDTWGVDFGLLTEAGELLGNPLHYRDSATDGVMEQAMKIVPRKAIFESTGVQFMRFNTLYQLLAMKAANSTALKCAHTLLFMPDMFNFLFTGVRKAEFSIATTSQFYDPRKKAWATDLFEALELPSKILPEIVPSGTVIGPLLKEVADECQVEAIPVIAPACHDTASAVAAVPAAGDDWCYISSGTWSLMGVEISQPIVNDKILKYNYTNEGGVGGSIRFLKNIMGLWLVQECRRHFHREGYEHSYGELTQMAARCKPLEVLIDLEHAPFLTPGDMPTKIAAFCQKTGQRAPSLRGEFVRACLDSLALTYRRTLEGLEDVLGRKIGVIHVVGGGSQNHLLNQMTADACNRPVIAGPVEATAIGNILVQAIATGAVASLAEARAIVRNSFEVKTFEPNRTAVWDDAYARYQRMTSIG